MIYALSTPNSAGITSMGGGLTAMSTMPVNIGRIDNEGWELLVSYRNNIGYFNYAVSGNVSQNRNRVVGSGPSRPISYGGGGHPNTGPSPCKTVNGQPISQFWGLKTGGMISPAGGDRRTQRQGAGQRLRPLPPAADGHRRPEYVDLNNDGTIDDGTAPSSAIPGRRCSTGSTSRSNGAASTSRPTSRASRATT